MSLHSDESHLLPVSGVSRNVCGSEHDDMHAILICILLPSLLPLAYSTKWDVHMSVESSTYTKYVPLK